MADIAIVIGHHPDAPGAALTIGDGQVHEHPLWVPFAGELAESLEPSLSAAVVERPNPEPDAALARRVNETGAACAIELHFNAAESTAAQGTEMLHYEGSRGGHQLAELLQHHTLEALGTKHRGTKGRSQYPFLAQTEMSAVICEPAFGSNEGDAFRLLRGLPALMAAYRRAVTTFLQNRSGT